MQESLSGSDEWVELGVSLSEHEARFFGQLAGEVQRCVTPRRKHYANTPLAMPWRTVKEVYRAAKNLRLRPDASLARLCVSQIETDPQAALFAYNLLYLWADELPVKDVCKSLELLDTFQAAYMSEPAAMMWAHVFGKVARSDAPDMHVVLLGLRRRAMAKLQQYDQGSQAQVALLQALLQLDERTWSGTLTGKDLQCLLAAMHEPVLWPDTGVQSAGSNEEEGQLLRLRILEKFHRGLARTQGFFEDLLTQCHGVDLVVWLLESGARHIRDAAYDALRPFAKPPNEDMRHCVWTKLRDAGTAQRLFDALISYGAALAADQPCDQMRVGGLVGFLCTVIQATAGLDLEAEPGDDLHIDQETPRASMLVDLLLCAEVAQGLELLELILQGLPGQGQAQPMRGWTNLRKEARLLLHLQRIFCKKESSHSRAATLFSILQPWMIESVRPQLLASMRDFYRYSRDVGHIYQHHDVPDGKYWTLHQRVTFREDHRVTKVIRYVCKKAQADEFYTELAILTFLLHDGIVRCYGGGINRTPGCDYGYIIMELLESDFTLVIERGAGLTHEQKLDLARQVLRPVIFMHSFKVAHNDIKPSNIMLQAHTGGGYTVKLIDVGCSRQTGADHTRTIYTHSIKYAAPEIKRKCDRRHSGGRAAAPENDAVDDDQYRTEGSQKSDVFSLGVVLTELWLGKILPTDGAHQHDSGWATLPQWLRALLERCMHQDWRERPTAAALLQGLEQGEEELADGDEVTARDDEGTEEEANES